MLNWWLLLWIIPWWIVGVGLFIWEERHEEDITVKWIFAGMLFGAYGPFWLIATIQRCIVQDVVILPKISTKKAKLEDDEDDYKPVKKPTSLAPAPISKVKPK